MSFDPSAPCALPALECAPKAAPAATGDAADSDPPPDPPALYRDSAGRAAKWPVEIAFLAATGVRPSLLDLVARRARRQRVGGDEVLIREGLIGEETYYRALAAHLGCAFIDRAVVLAPGFDYRAAMRAGVARAHPHHEKFDWLMAPRGREIRRLIALGPTGARRIALCAPCLFSALARAAGRGALAADASFALARAEPRLSAANSALRWSSRLSAAFCLTTLGSLFLVSPAVCVGLSLLLSLLYSGGLYVRLCALVAAHAPTRPPPPPLDDRDLPRYSIVAPMYREAKVAAQFLRALRGLDYPRAKLQVLIVLEPDDHATAAALRLAGLPPYAEIIVAPQGAPRTKPRALNTALPLARGELLTILDAEDRPEPGQLRAAAAAFARASPRLACLQARLAIDNGAENWLAYFFALDYAALFDIVNPGLAALGLPLPLGGTSNHFRTRILRRVRGWDAWNVTEDADLGLRLARLGYQVETLNIATYEDAPVDLRGWLGQRSRWMKGWMQTFAVFLRRPRRQIRRLGRLPSFCAVCAMSSLLAGPLFGPFYGLRLGYDLCYGDLLRPQDPAALLHSSLSLAVALFGLAAFILPIACGMRRRGLRASLKLLLAPAYLLLLSLAAWRALWEWTTNPYAWTKTDHVARPPQEADGKNFPASASAISARTLSTP